MSENNTRQRSGLTAFPNDPQLAFVLNEAVPTVFADRVVVGARPDGVHVLHFISNVGGHAIEQARVIVLKDHFKRIIAAMAKNADFYPSPPESSGKEEPSSKDAEEANEE